MVTPLGVPFEEKDEAKSLGARWNAVEKFWFVPDGVDTEPFTKWIIPTRPELEVIPETDLVYPDGKGPKLGTQDVALELLDSHCWKCGRDVVKPTGVLLPHSKSRTKPSGFFRKWLMGRLSLHDRPCRFDHNLLYYFHISLSCLSDQTRLAYWVDYYRRNNSNIAPVSMCYSKTVNSYYFAATCPHCGALFGDFPTMEERLSAQHDRRNISFLSVRITITKDDLRNPGWEATAWAVNDYDMSERLFFDSFLEWLPYREGKQDDSGALCSFYRKHERNIQLLFVNNGTHTGPLKDEDVFRQYLKDTQAPQSLLDALERVIVQWSDRW